MRLITKKGINLRTSPRLTVLAVMVAVIVTAHKLEIAIKRSLALKSELNDSPRLGSPQLRGHLIWNVLVLYKRPKMNLFTRLSQ